MLNVRYDKIEMMGAVWESVTVANRRLNAHISFIFFFGVCKFYQSCRTEPKLRSSCLGFKGIPV